MYGHCVQCIQISRLKNANVLSQSVLGLLNFNLLQQTVTLGTFHYFILVWQFDTYHLLIYIRTYHCKAILKYGSVLCTWAGPEDAPAFVIGVRRIPFEMIILYGSVSCTWVGSDLWSK